jgi:hypothetical protein
MGSTSSKAARKLPKRTEVPSWTSGTTQAPNVDSVRPGTRSTRPLASEEKNEGSSQNVSLWFEPVGMTFYTLAIVNDAADPHFLSNLNRLGPVSVNQPLQPIRSAAVRDSSNHPVTQALIPASSGSEIPTTTRKSHPLRPTGNSTCSG